MGQGQSFDNGPGLAIRKHQGAPTTTGQIDASALNYEEPPFDELRYLHVQHLSFRIPQILLSHTHGSSSFIFQQAKYAIVIPT